MNRRFTFWVAACLTLLVVPLCFCSVSANLTDLFAAGEQAESCCSHEALPEEAPQDHQEAEDCPCCKAHGELAKLVPAEVASVQTLVVRMDSLPSIDVRLISSSGSIRAVPDFRHGPPGSCSLQSLHQLMRC